MFQFRGNEDCLNFVQKKFYNIYAWWEICPRWKEKIFVLLDLGFNFMARTFKIWSICFLNGPFPGSFSLFLSFQYSWQYTNVLYKRLPMTRCEPRISCVWSDRSTNHCTIFFFISVLDLSWICSRIIGVEGEHVDH